MEPEAVSVYRFDRFVLDLARGALSANGVERPLRPKSFTLLQYFVENSGRLIGRDEIMQAVWPGVFVTDDSIAQCIKEIRRALGDDEQRLLRTLPRRGYMFAVVGQEAGGLTGAQAREPGDGRHAGARQDLTLPHKPSIAVLPFANLSQDPEQGYFADGITEDIITELSRFSEMFVIARNSSFAYKGKAIDVCEVGRELGVRYVLEGSIRRAGDRVRITGQLIDARTGAHRWAERYDRELKDVFAVQDEVARTIAAILVAHVNKAEFERTALRPPTSWQAHDYYIRAAGILLSFWSSFKRQDLYEAQRLFRQALVIDPHHARAYAQLTIIDSILYSWSLDADYLNPTVLDRAIQSGRKAVQLDPDLPLAHCCLVVPLSQKGQHEAAVAAIDKALALNPSYTEPRFILGLVWAGEHARAIELARIHMRSDPFHSPFAPLWLGLAHYMLKSYADALPPILESLARTPNARGPHQQLAMTYAQLGRLPEAREEVAEVLRVEPGYTIERVSRANRFKNPGDADHFFGGLRKAGLPER
jgi:adenylate cyclase